MLNMSFESIKKLEQNSDDVYNEASRLLIKIAENILKYPNNIKIRTLQKTNGTIATKVLVANGARECLIQMGFKECNTALTLPMETPLNRLEVFIDELVKRKNNLRVIKENKVSPDTIASNVPSTSSHVEPVKEEEPEIFIRVQPPPYTSIFTNAFLKMVESRFNKALVYENEHLQTRAKKIIPLARLEKEAQLKLRALQEQIKKSKKHSITDDDEMSLQDMLLLELLNWFKTEFFTWVNNPECDKCGGNSTFSHLSVDKDVLVYTDRVEMHRCNVCSSLIAFPRFSDLNILLETRRGRCGEWATVFTLLCRSMGWDARLVIDENDHVWTEVYSHTQHRWLHCDACENLCDTPLVYESGWSKEMAYVVAYSAEEVQDVTWRYSSHHQAVRERRKLCPETELVAALIKLRTTRQTERCSDVRRKYLTQRLVLELADLMMERQPSEKDQHGRVSGSQAWKLSRGEIQLDDTNTPYTWCLDGEDIFKNGVCLKYSTSQDKYILSGQCGKELVGWQHGTFSTNGLFRKEEKDWKVVYISRKEGIVDGNISWKFEVNNEDYVIDTVDVKLEHALFETGKIEINITSDNSSIVYDSTDPIAAGKHFSGEKWLTITANLSGGKNNVAWQHAQLFREKMDSTDYPFSVVITFQKINL